MTFHQCQSETGVIENVGVAAENASKSISVQKLFLLPVFAAAIFNVGFWLMSDDVVRAISGSGVGRKCGGSRSNHIEI